jgi:hypothetical protein
MLQASRLDEIRTVDPHVRAEFLCMGSYLLSGMADMGS